MANLNYAHIFFENSDHSYITDLSIKTTVESVTDYFLNTSFDVGNYPVENLKKCVGLHFYSKNNDCDYFIGSCSDENIKKFGLVTCKNKEIESINGIFFNAMGELIETNKNHSLNDLMITHDKLIKDGEYIKASRINHLIQIKTTFKHN